MKKTETFVTIICDICKNKVENDKCLTVKFPVVFTTEQTEGRSTKPYISYNELDLCINCQKKILTVQGQGAQGYNSFDLIREKEQYLLDNLKR